MLVKARGRSNHVPLRCSAYKYLSNADSTNLDASLDVLLTFAVALPTCLPDMQTELEPYASLWSVANEFSVRRESWLFGPVRELQPDDVDTLVGEWLKKVSVLNRCLAEQVLA